MVEKQETIKEGKRRISIKCAAELLGMSELSVKGCLINNALPIGGAWKNPGSDCYNYHISAAKLADYLGMTIEEVMQKNSHVKASA